jgi:hypothetical protein
MQEHTVYARLITTALVYNIHLFAATFLIFFLKVFNLQGKYASRSAGNWIQFMMVLFTNVRSLFPGPNLMVMILPTLIAGP